MIDMKNDFKYIRDPLFLFSLALYSLNKFFLPLSNYFGTNFLHFYLNDVLLVPVLLPIILYSSRIFGFRKDDRPPRFIELTIPLLLWSIAFEFIGPRFFKLGFSDPLDIVCYCSGGIFSWIIWNKRRFLIYRHEISFSSLRRVMQWHLPYNWVLKLAALRSSGARMRRPIERRSLAPRR